MMRLINHQDRLGALLLIAIGTFAAVYSLRWDIGTVARMGPGFFPMVLGALLAVIGAVILLASLRISELPLPRPKLAELFWIVLSLVTFALLLERIGFVLTSLIAVPIASMADRQTSWTLRIILAVSVTLICYLIFKLALGMVLPLWWFD